MTAENYSVVAITDRKVFAYECSDSCQTVFGDMTQTWSLFKYNSAGDLQDTNVIDTVGLLMSSELDSSSVWMHKIR